VDTGRRVYDKVLIFDIPMETSKEVVDMMYIHRTEFAAPALPAAMNIEIAHRFLGHQSEEATRKAAKQFSWIITRGNLTTNPIPMYNRKSQTVKYYEKCQRSS
jgi:hypothetical protein